MIIRVARRRRFAVIDQRAINDSRLSFRARGVLAWLLDKPDDWRCNSRTIAVAGREGRDAVQAALRELEQAGYLSRARRQNDRGRWLTFTTVHERPVDEPVDEPVDTVGTEAGFPGAGKPGAGGPGALPKTETNDSHQSDDSHPVDDVTTPAATVREVETAAERCRP